MWLSTFIHTYILLPHTCSNTHKKDSSNKKNPDFVYLFSTAKKLYTYKEDSSNKNTVKTTQNIINLFWLEFTVVNKKLRII